MTQTAAGTETIIIPRNLVIHSVSETTCLTYPFKMSYQARFMPFRAPRPVTKPTNSNNDLRHLVKQEVSEPTCLTDRPRENLVPHEVLGLAGGTGVVLGSWCLAGVLGLNGVLVSCWALGVLVGSWCGLWGLATTTPPTTLFMEFGAV